MAAEPAPAPALTELESLQLKCNNITDESLESTRRMKGMCEEAKDMGIKTLVMLDDQGEQLEKFETGVDGINSDMRLAEEALKSMDLLCGIFPKFWKKSGGFKEDDAVWGDGAQKVRKFVYLLGFVKFLLRSFLDVTIFLTNSSDSFTNLSMNFFSIRAVEKEKQISICPKQGFFSQ